MKKCKYFSLGKSLKSQTKIAKKQYKKSDDKIIKKEKLTLGKYSKSNLIRETNHSFYKYYRDIKKIW